MNLVLNNLQKSYGIKPNQPTNQPTNQTTDWMHIGILLQWWEPYYFYYIGGLLLQQWSVNWIP